MIALTLALSACASTPETVPLCPAERAIYTLRAEPAAQLRTLRTPHPLNAYSELAARVEFEGETYWFAFVSSLGYSRDYIGRTEDPFAAAQREDDGGDSAEPEYNGSELISLNARYNLIEGVPQAGEPAPAHLVATGVGSAIWYSIPRRQLPKSIWDLTSCADVQP